MNAFKRARRFVTMLVLGVALMHVRISAADEAPNPHGNNPHGGNLFGAPENLSFEEPTLPVGTLDVTIADPEGKPMPNVSVTLGIVYNSVDKGESRKRLSVTTNERGIARFANLDTGSAVAYRPSVFSNGATFAVMPFRMPEKGGLGAKLHVYPVVESIEEAVVATQSVVYAEVKDDRIQVDQILAIYNMGKTAWVPRDLVLALPPTFTALTSQQSMSDVGVDAVPKTGARLRGTFGPGQHNVEFRWQLPYAGEEDVRFAVGMLPRTAAARVIAPASRNMSLEATGFPSPESKTDGAGARVLVTEKQFRPGDTPLRSLEVSIRGLPTDGPGKVAATLLAGAILIGGLVLGSRASRRQTSSAQQTRLLAELEALERAHKAGDVGPKTFERARRELIDELAQTFAS